MADSRASQIRNRFTLVSLIALASFILYACNAKPGASPKVYAFHGTVVSVDEKDKTANIKGDAVKGWMEAMTMDYPVPDQSDLAKLKAGVEFKADLVVTGDEYALHHIAPLGAAEK